MPGTSRFENFLAYIESRCTFPSFEIMISDQFSRSADPNVSTLLVFHSLEEAAARGEKKLEVRSRFCKNIV